MSRGLYARPGASAAATAAAWANRLDEPITKLSKTYFGFSRVSSTLPTGLAVGASGDESTERFVDLSPKRSVDVPTWPSIAPAPRGLGGAEPSSTGARLGSTVSARRTGVPRA